MCAQYYLCGHGGVAGDIGRNPIIDIEHAYFCIYSTHIVNRYRGIPRLTENAGNCLLKKGIETTLNYQNNVANIISPVILLIFRRWKNKSQTLICYRCRTQIILCISSTGQTLVVSVWIRESLYKSIYCTLVMLTDLPVACNGLRTSVPMTVNSAQIVSNASLYYNYSTLN